MWCASADERLEEGVVLGAIYSDADTPDAVPEPQIPEAVRRWALLEYDKAAHKFKVAAPNGDSLKDILTLILKAVQPILVLYGNNPDYAKLTQALTKINNLFS